MLQQAKLRVWVVDLASTIGTKISYKGLLLCLVGGATPHPPFFVAHTRGSTQPLLFTTKPIPIG